MSPSQTNLREHCARYVVVIMKIQYKIHSQVTAGFPQGTREKIGIEPNSRTSPLLGYLIIALGKIRKYTDIV